MTRIKRILDAVWEAFRYLFLTPSWGSKRRRAQEEYERMLEEGRSCFFNWVYLRVFNLDVYKMLCKRGINHKK
jgi:hypothetical protein